MTMYGYCCHVAIRAGAPNCYLELLDKPQYANI